MAESMVNLAELFGAATPEARAGAYAIAEFLDLFRQVHAKK